MKFSKSRENKKQSFKTENIPLKVTGFVSGKNAEGADAVIAFKGTRVDTGEDITVRLTDRGRDAANPRRTSLDTLSKGFKMGRNEYQVEIGGVMSFKGAWKNGEEYIASWPNVLAFNASDADKYMQHQEAVMLRMFPPKKDEQGKEQGNWRGKVYIFDSNAENHVAGKVEHVADIAATAIGTAQASNTKDPAFCVRLLNENNELLSYGMPGGNFYNKDESRRMNDQEKVQHLTDGINKMLQEQPNTRSINIMNIERLSVSPKSLEANSDGKNQVKTFLAIEKAYNQEDEAGEMETVCKATCLKLGGDNNAFVNGMWPIDPYGPGVMPELIGNVLALGEFEKQKQTEAEVAQKAPQPETAVPVAEESVTQEAPVPPVEVTEPQGPEDMDDNDPFSELDEMCSSPGI